MLDLNLFLAQNPLLAQVETAAETSAPLWPLFIVIALIAIIVFFVLLRKKPSEEAEERPRAEEGQRPTRDLLEDRPEVEAPVEIHEGMSLAEIKRAKRSRVVGDKSKRVTAAEATEKAKKEHEELETKAAEAREKESVEAPVAEAPVAEEPVAEEPVGEEPVAEEPVGEEPVAEEPVAEEPEETTEPKPEVEKPSPLAGLKKPLPRPTLPKSGEGDEAKKPALKLPRPGKELPKPAMAAEEPVAEEPVAEEPVAEAPVAKEPVAEAPVAEAPVAEEPVKETPRTMVEKPEAKSLRDGLQKTRSGFVDRLGNLFKREKLDQDLVDEVEEILFTADIGTKIAGDIMKAVENEMSSADKDDPGAVWQFIRDYCEEILSKNQTPLDFESKKPFVMLVIGVNGVGKTTTIGKLASKLRREGKKVLLVAGDTFRAAAVDQLGIWAERTAIPLHSGEDGADPASVIYGGIERGAREEYDVVICDTAGRLHTKANLLDELKKIGRVAGKALDGAPHETVLVLDANTGQNAIAQAKLFKEALDITGIVLTKLDGTAKGGVILGICDEIAAPVRYIGIGEGVDDLRPFDPAEFVEALFM